MVGYEFFTFMKYGMPRVAATVVAQNVRIGVFVAEIVRDFPLSTVSVLEVHYHIHLQHCYLMIAAGGEGGNPPDGGDALDEEAEEIERGDEKIIHIRTGCGCRCVSRSVGDCRSSGP